MLSCWFCVSFVRLVRRSDVTLFLFGLWFVRCAGLFCFHLFQFGGCVAWCVFDDLICKVLRVTAACWCVVEFRVVFLCWFGLICRAMCCCVSKCVVVICFT